MQRLQLIESKGNIVKKNIYSIYLFILSKKSKTKIIGVCLTSKYSFQFFYLKIGGKKIPIVSKAKCTFTQIDGKKVYILKL